MASRTRPSLRLFFTWVQRSRAEGGLGTRLVYIHNFYIDSGLVVGLYVSYAQTGWKGQVAKGGGGVT